MLAFRACLDALLGMGGSGWNCQCAYESHMISLSQALPHTLSFCEDVLFVCLLFAAVESFWKPGRALCRQLPATQPSPVFFVFTHDNGEALRTETMLSNHTPRFISNNGVDVSQNTCVEFSFSSRPCGHPFAT